MDAEAYKKSIYADNAATTKMSETALRAYIDCAEKAFANPSSDHEAGMEAKKYLEAARKTVGDAFSAENGKVIFTSGGSEADNQAILSAAKYGKTLCKKHIITTSFEHHAVLKTVKSLEDAGFEATYLPIQKNGTVKLADVEKALSEDTFLVSVMAVNNEVGTIQPIKQIGKLCKKHGVLFHVDGVQAAGKIPINIEDFNIDYLAISAHKFRGPKGVGALITSENAPLTPLILGGSQEFSLRAGTENVQSIYSMAKALEEAINNMERDGEYVASLRNRLEKGLLQIPGTAVNGDLKKRIPGTLSIAFRGVNGKSLLFMLDAVEHIRASGGAACTSGDGQPSYTLKAMGLSDERAFSSLRFSLSADNTPSDVERIISATARCVEKLKEQKR